MAKTVAIIGLGYVGLPLACLCAKKGFNVFGIDTNPKLVESVNSGKSHIKDELLSQQLMELKGKISASTNPDKITMADVVIVCVPTPVDKNFLPDLFPLKSACENISANMRKGQLIVIESTIYPGTTEEIVKPILEKNNLKAEKDFFLVHCPERIDPGNKKWGVSNIPRVLGGLSNNGTNIAKEFYKSIVNAKITVLNSVKEAEAVKMTENSFRDINIAFVNELAKSFAKMEIDFMEVIKGASTKPFGFMPFFPGPGVGGHCIPVDPYYLIEKSKSKGFEMQFLKLARQINNSMPAYVVELAENKLGELKGKNICVLGLAYKANVDDTRESPSLKIVELLKQKNAVVKTFDPFVLNKSNCDSVESAVFGSDCVIIATNHDLFKEKLLPEFLKKEKVSCVLDTKNMLLNEEIQKAGIRYISIGR